ncbi:MAG TPA: heparan-alpha-glucosaminide N-acetyltransferase domain-containing protein [Gemmatimonadales bacterium]|nr:heparan-alpha-glucosaminide N-acetyltransferase domain-containing protein [Gemmatimonadales bacterium]
MSKRLESIDTLRGLVMVIMALDHVRDFVHRGAMEYSPTDLTRTSPELFFTRWITHFCAPTFMLTAGLGAFLWMQRGRTRADLSRFLVTRGLWLCLLELTVMRLAYNFSFSLQYPLLLIVLWVLGVCMIGLAGLIWLPRPWLWAFCLLAIAGHNLADGIGANALGSLGWAWNLVHQPGAFTIGKVVVFVAYPLLPWVAVMGLGYCIGEWYLLAPERRRRRLTIAGVACVLGFLVVRGLNVYGDPAPWSAQASGTFTFLSFLNTTKYPPSLAFLLMTLGPALLLLAWLDRETPAWSRPLNVFGRVPLFYFVAHFYSAHLAAVLLGFLRYGSRAAGFTFYPVPSMGAPAGVYPADYGFSLGVTWLVYAAIVLLMYPACRWFSGVKSRSGAWWVSYL